MHISENPCSSGNGTCPVCTSNDFPRSNQHRDEWGHLSLQAQSDRPSEQRALRLPSSNRDNYSRVGIATRLFMRTSVSASLPLCLEPPYKHLSCSQNALCLSRQRPICRSNSDGNLINVDVLPCDFARPSIGWLPPGRWTLGYFPLCRVPLDDSRVGTIGRQQQYQQDGLGRTSLLHAKAEVDETSPERPVVAKTVLGAVSGGNGAKPTSSDPGPSIKDAISAFSKGTNEGIFS